MDGRSFQEAVESICARDARYAAEAYYFLREALDYTGKAVQREQHRRPAGGPRHVTGAELCHGIREYALQEFGPLAFLVLTTWGLHKTEDFGEMVYTLIAAGKLGASENDKKSDFTAVFDFEEAFVLPYAVDEPPPARKRPRRN